MNSIHNNQGREFVQMPIKPELAGDDRFIIEDSENNFNKAQVTIHEIINYNADETQNLNGFDRNNIDTMPDVSWDDTTRTLTVSVKSTSSNYIFWSNNRKITKTSTEIITIPDEIGSYYFYFDENGDLQYVKQADMTTDLFYKYAIVAFVYWNSDLAKGLFNPDEMHGRDMAGATHENIHNTVGARHYTGITIEGLSNGSSTYTQSTSGKFYDEDILHEIDTNAIGHIFLYRYGTNGDWYWTDPSLEVAYKETGDTYYSWNEWDGTIWKLSEGTRSTDYWIIFFVIAPRGVIKIIGQNAYSSRSKARKAIETELSNLVLNGLPTPEFVFLGAVIVNRDGEVQKMADGSVFYDLLISKGGRTGSDKTAYLDDTLWYNLQDITADTTLTSSGVYVSNGTATITLPVSGEISNFMCRVKNINATAVSIAVQGTDLIDGATSKSLAQWESVLIADKGDGNFYIF